ncbi:MAG TPA: hypothetical protein PKM57_16255, partial [Kiritimatiellia bacterium]|nr:hypothetical protein [Kiritimatiellia bacterium]
MDAWKRMENGRSCRFGRQPALRAGVVVALLAGVASAETYTWSTNATGAATDGSGAWNTSTANWVGAGDAHTTWDNGSGDTAAFGAGGTAGTVTVASAGISIGGLTFNSGVTGAYLLSGGP